MKISGSFGAAEATTGWTMRTGSPDFERRRKLREDLRGGWDSFLLLWDSGMGGMPFDFWDGKLVTEPFDESMVLALVVRAYDGN